MKRLKLIRILIFRKGVLIWFIPHQDLSMMFLLRHLQIKETRKMQPSTDQASRPERSRWTPRIILVGKAIARKLLTICTTKAKIMFLLQEYRVIFHQAWRKSVKIRSTPQSDRWVLAKSLNNSTCILIRICSVMEPAKVIFHTGRHL